MTAFMCSLFYVYTIFAVNYYRREINYRINEEYHNNIKIKAPFSLRNSVLLSFIAVILNIILQVIYGSETSVLINAIPICVFMLRLRRYEKIIIKMDKKE